MTATEKKWIGLLEHEIADAISRLADLALPPELEALEALVPPVGMKVTVQLRHKPGMGFQRPKIKSNADASCWDAHTCEALICYQPDVRSGRDSEPAARPVSASQVVNPLADLVKILDRAEHDRRFPQFVGITPFREKYLEQYGAAWARDPAARNSVLTQATQQHLVLTGTVPNPKNPEFPTTAIRLNREHPEVRQILAITAAERSPFAPVAIQGGDLSSTVLSERR